MAAELVEGEFRVEVGRGVIRIRPQCAPEQRLSLAAARLRGEQVGGTAGRARSRAASGASMYAAALMPKVVLDQHIGVVAFFLVLVLWVGLLVFKAQTCVALGFPQMDVPGCAP